MSELAVFQSEDSLTARLGDAIDVHAIATAFRDSGYWEEVVPGMADLTVKYDPLTMAGEEAETRFRSIWERPLQADDLAIEPACLAAHFAGAPDQEIIAPALGIDAIALPDWLCQRSYRVTMMGFQPGFAYLEDMEPSDLPDLPRLDTPRQRVAAGSIGFLGKRACIYSLDGPGGWPIVGRVSEPLFRRDDERPFLLEPGEIVRFRPA